MYKLLLLVVAVMLLRCSAPNRTVVLGQATDEPKRSIPIWVDKNFTPAEKSEITGAVRIWDDALNGHIRLAIVSFDFDMEIPVINEAIRRQGWLILRIPSTDPKIHDSDGNVTLAWVNPGGWMYIIYDRLIPGKVRPVTVHEIGHLLGVEHGGNFVMRPQLYNVDFVCIDNWTAGKVEVYQGLPKGSVTYCVDNYE